MSCLASILLFSAGVVILGSFFVPWYSTESSGAGRYVSVSPIEPVGVSADLSAHPDISIIGKWFWRTSIMMSAFTGIIAGFLVLEDCVPPLVTYCLTLTCFISACLAIFPFEFMPTDASVSNSTLEAGFFMSVTAIWFVLVAICVMCCAESDPEMVLCGAPQKRSLNPVFDSSGLYKPVPLVEPSFSPAASESHARKKPSSASALFESVMRDSPLPGRVPTFSPQAAGCTSPVFNSSPAWQTGYVQPFSPSVCGSNAASPMRGPPRGVFPQSSYMSPISPPPPAPGMGFPLADLSTPPKHIAPNYALHDPYVPVARSRSSHASQDLQRSLDDVSAKLNAFREAQASEQFDYHQRLSSMRVSTTY